MSKTHLHDKATVREHPTVPVSIKVEVVTVFEDVLSCSPAGGVSIGGHVDRMIESLGLQGGGRLGKIVIDLSEFSKVFIGDRTTAM